MMVCSCSGLPETISSVHSKVGLGLHSSSTVGSPNDPIASHSNIKSPGQVIVGVAHGLTHVSLSSSQPSEVHGSESTHGGVPGWHPFFGWHVSRPLQKSPSSHTSGSPATHPFCAWQVSIPLQTFLSPH